MSVEAFLESEYAVLLSHPVVRSVEVVRYSVNRLDGYLRARCMLANGEYLEIALHLSVSNQVVAMDDYRYQWMDSAQTLLRRRWDNTPHFTSLPGLPHHCHVGSEGAVEPSSPMNLAELLDHIADLIA
jgi:hypothetical protein